MLANGDPYVLPAQLPQYLPAAVVNLATAGQQMQACIDTSETADSYFRIRYTLPMQAVGSDVVRYTAYVACFLLLSGAVGFAPQAGADENVQRNYYAAVGWPDRPGSGWFPAVGSQRLTPDVTPTLLPGNDPTHDQPQVQSQPLRGWQQVNARGRPCVG